MLWFDHEPLLSMSSKEAPLTLALDVEERKELKECALNISVFIPDFFKTFFSQFEIVDDCAGP